MRKRFDMADTQLPGVSGPRFTIPKLPPVKQKKPDYRAKPGVWQILSKLLAAKLPLKGLTISRFDDSNEHLFWEECRVEAVRTLKSALIVGIAAFTVFNTFDLIYSVPDAQRCLRLLAVTVLLILLYKLSRAARPQDCVNVVAKTSTAVCASSVLIILLAERNPAFYSTTWAGLLPLYFFCYGQLFLYLAEALVFGFTAMAATIVCGLWLGVEEKQLALSAFLLLLINLFGYCTRIQLENHSRRAFWARRTAEMAAEHKSQFLRQIAHNLRQPLQAINCYASVLDVAYHAKPLDSLRPVVDRMGTAIDDLCNAFNCVLDISNLETGKKRPVLAPVSINQLLFSLENQFAPLAEKRGLRLKFHLRTQPPYTVFSNIGMLSQVLSNLLDNAIKYTAAGWVTVGAVKAGKDRLKIHVYDSGSGIACGMHEDIFKEFFRGHRRQADSQGLGIGLAYVNAAINTMPDHSIKLSSRLGKGSDFQLYLPMFPSQARLVQTFIPTQGLQDKLIFIVDDDTDVLTALTRQLEAWGCNVLAACSLAQTLVLLKDCCLPPDLLITDFYLQAQETAHDIIAAVHDDCGPVPCLVLSACAIPPQEKAKWPANTHLLRKPANANVLKETLVRAMSGP